MKEYITNSREQTQKIASDFALSLKGGEVLCFYGNLGTGKTTFIQSLAKSIGVKENVTSPTFVLMKKYLCRGGVTPPKKQTGRGNRAPTNFYHMDAYRLSSSDEALELGLEEIWSDPKNIIAIEWADKISDILPDKKVDLCFEHIDGDKRKITIFE